jgi:hypothetical protein
LNQFATSLKKIEATATDNGRNFVQELGEFGVNLNGQMMQTMNTMNTMVIGKTLMIALLLHLDWTVYC